MEEEILDKVKAKPVTQGIYSLYIRIPKHWAKILGITVKKKLNLKLFRDRIVIEK